MGKYDDAKASFDKALKMSEESNQSAEIKANARLFGHFNPARVALGKNDLAMAKSEAAAFQTGAEASKNANQLKIAHSLNGSIALAEKNYDKALTELAQAIRRTPGSLTAVPVSGQG